MAQLWAGQPKDAVATLERVKHADPYGYYGTEADNLLTLGREVPGLSGCTSRRRRPRVR